MSSAPPPGSAAEDSAQTREALHRISQANRWSLLELPPSPGVRPGGLAGFHRASPSTPLDASSYVLGRVANPLDAQRGIRRSRRMPGVMPRTDEPLSPRCAEPASQPVRSSLARSG